MVTNIFSLSDSLFNTLLRTPQTTLSSNLNRTAYHAKILIPGFRQNTQRYYQDYIETSTSDIATAKQLPVDFQDFGLHIEFEKPIELHIYDDTSTILGNVKELIQQFGLIVFQNVYLIEEHRKDGHRNRFPHLHFHRDRNQNQPTPYSLFCRDPFDPIQKEPRLSSTLFTSYLVAYLQALKERQYDIIQKQGGQSHYDLFQQEEKKQILKDLFGSVILQHPWSAPQGVGEITIMDNRTILHASYYRSVEKGYRIGVRYLG